MEHNRLKTISCGEQKDPLAMNDPKINHLDVQSSSNALLASKSEEVQSALAPKLLGDPRKKEYYYLKGN